MLHNKQNSELVLPYLFKAITMQLAYENSIFLNAFPYNKIKFFNLNKVETGLELSPIYILLSLDSVNVKLGISLLYDE